MDEQGRVVAVAADEVVQFYLKALDSKLPAPLTNWSASSAFTLSRDSAKLSQ